MSDLISRESVIETLKQSGIITDNDLGNLVVEEIERIPTAYDVADNELRILKNHIEQMPKVYRKRNVNWVIVQELLMAGTLRAERTSSIKKCFELGIDTYDYDLIVNGGGQG